MAAMDPAVVTDTSSDRAAPSPNATLLLVFAAGAAVAVFFGVYAHVHDPTGESTLTLFFTGTLNLKVWFTTVAVFFAIVQIVTALRIYGKVKVPKQMPKWLGDVHRLAGTVAFLFTLPVAFHCLWSLGYQTGDTRVAVHSFLGCAFFGVFTVKVLGVRIHRLPGWVLPVVGSTLFATLVLLWATSSLWFFQNVDFPGV